MRAFFRGLGRFIWRFMVIFSFIVNFILVAVLIFLGIFLFNITNNIANPLVSGLHSSFVGLEEANIDWTIPVRDTIDVKFTVPLQTDTVVVLTEPVPLSASAQITLNNSTVSTPVTLTLPVGLRLPVRLDLLVPIDETLPVSLDVRAVIPLEETQLADVAQNLRLLFEPLSYSLNNLPKDWNGAIQMASDVLAGKDVNLITQPTDYSQQPWPGYSITAGENYANNFENQRLNSRGTSSVTETGIVPEGGIQWLDMQLPNRSYLYLDGCNPEAFNAQAAECAQAENAAASGGVPDGAGGVVTSGDGSTGNPGQQPPQATLIPFPTSTPMNGAGNTGTGGDSPGSEGSNTAVPTPGG